MANHVKFWFMAIVAFLVCTVIFYVRVFVSTPQTRQIMPATSGLRYKQKTRLPTSVPNVKLGVPNRYDTVVDFRVIVIVYNRAESLSKVLHSLDDMILDGDSAALEIFVDRSVNGEVDAATVKVAMEYSWKQGTTRVHVQEEHAGIYGQWIEAWDPPRELSANGKEELCLILEDDYNVSIMTYRWLRAVHNAYGQRADFFSASLTSFQQKHAGGGRLSCPQSEIAYMYRCLGTEGLSPSPGPWRIFLAWYETYVTKQQFHPYINGIVPTTWYRGFEARKYEYSMWEMWPLYFSNMLQSFTVYSNLPAHNSDKKSCLLVARREPGLHGGGQPDDCQLLSEWSDSFVAFQQNITKLNWDGAVVN